MQETIFTIFFLSAIAAITPGPLMALIISETLRHGKGNGIKIALAPLITDLPIMLLGILVLSKLEHLDTLLGFISLLGAGYLMYLAYENVTIKAVHLEKVPKSKSIAKGIIANFLNPNPYIFYFSILGPLAVKGMKENFLFGPLSVVVFLGVFVLILIGIVLTVHAAKRFVSSKRYIYTIRFLGVLLFFFALMFLRDSLEFFGVI